MIWVRDDADETYPGFSATVADFIYGRQLAAEAVRVGGEFRRFRFHDLRHRFAVDYLRTGRGGLYTLQQELGHTSLKVTEMYLAFLTADEARVAKDATAQNTAQVYRFAPAGDR